MRFHAINGLLWVSIVALAVMAGGCNEQEQIQALRSQNDALMQDNGNYRDQIAEMEQRVVQLKADCDTKDATIAAKNEELATLRAQKPVETASGWQKTPFGDKIDLGSDVLFGAGRAKLTSAGQQTLAPIVRDLKGQYAGLPIRVYGYTDNDPIKKTRKQWQDNLDLSANRAMEVTRHLIRQGIPAETIETVAMGATNFLTSNQTSVGKAKNRRVEIFVVKAP